LPKRLGVSVGSLYQYFPSKQALVVAVIVRHNDGPMQIARGAQRGPAPLGTVVGGSRCNARRRGDAPDRQYLQ
jgi:AcrR family transcriptional regulator